MARRQKRVQEHPVIFNRGLNTSVSDVGYDLHPVKMNNCWLSRDDRGGAVEVIPGYTTFHTFADTDVAIQSIASAGVKRYSFAIYGLGGTKFYRYVVTNKPIGGDVDSNKATKTGLTGGAKGSIIFYGDVDGLPHAWVFNGNDAAFKSTDYWGSYVDSGLYNITSVGVARPYADDYAAGDATDRIYIVAGDADSGPSVQFFYNVDAPTYTDDTTDANDDDAADVALGPTTWRADNADGFYVASDTPFGGLMYEGYAPQGGTPKGKFTYKYWNGSGWQKLRGISDDTVDSSGFGFAVAAATVPDPEVTWTVPDNWEKNSVNSQGPYFWVWCCKTAGVVGSSAATAGRVYLLDQKFGEDEAEGVVQYYLSKLTGTSESALSTKLKQADGTEGIDAGKGGTVKIVIDKSNAGGVGDDPNEATYYDSATFIVYRTYKDGAQPYDTGLRIETSAAGAGEVEDNIPDADLGNLPYLHGDTPPTGALPAVTHFNRIFVAVPSESKVYWSDLANPESFWTDDNGSYTQVFYGDGDEITALARDRDGVLVFKHNHLYKISGRTPDEFYVTEISLADPSGGSVGTPSIRSITYTPSGIVFYWNKAVYLYNGSYPIKISKQIDQELRAIDSKDEVEGVCVGYYGHRNQVYVSVPIASATPDTTYIFDMDVGEWSGVITQGFRQFLSVKIDANTDVTEFASETGEHFLGVDPAATGKVFRLDDGTTFNGSAINTNFRLSPFFGSSLNALKTFLYVDVIFEPVADGLFNLEWWIDGESGDSTTVSMAMDKTGYARHRRRVNIGYMGHSLDLKLKNNASYSGSWKIYGFVIGYIEHESFSL